MKKLFWAAAAVAAIFTVSGASAQCPVCGQTIKMKADQRDIHRAYVAGDVSFDKMEAGMIGTGYNWRVKEKKHRETWVAGNPMGQDVYVKMKEGKTGKKVKVHVGKERLFVKDLNKGNGKKHVAKILEEGKRYVAKDITTENGCQVIARVQAEEQAKKDKKESKKNK